MASASAIAATSHVICTALDPPIVCTRNEVAVWPLATKAAGSINATNEKLKTLGSHVGRASPPSAIWRDRLRSRVARTRWLDHRARDAQADGAQNRFDDPSCGKTPALDDETAREYLDEQRNRLPRVRLPLDSLEVGFTIERETGAVEERLIGARPKCVPERHQQARGEHTGHTLAQPTQKHADDLNGRSCDEALSMAELICEPAGRDLERHERQVARSKEHRQRRSGDVFLLYPPEEIQAVHHSFEAGDSIRQVEGDVSTRRASTFGGHERRLHTV